MFTELADLDLAELFLCYKTTIHCPKNKYKSNFFKYRYYKKIIISPFHVPCLSYPLNFKNAINR